MLSANCASRRILLCNTNNKLSSAEYYCWRHYLQQQLPVVVVAASANTTNNRTYISRAHPQPKPEFAIPTAVQSVLTEVEKRKARRVRKWDRYSDYRKEKGIPDDGGPFRNQDETIELAVNLNVDPRKPGQSLRGSVSLPNGTGKKIACVVFTESEELATLAKEQGGALHAGGEALVDQIVSGDIPVDSFQRALATQDVMGVVTKKAARLLGPRGLMPNAKVGTLLSANAEDLLEALETQLAGKELQYRTEKEGILHLPVGKGSFGVEKLLENISVIINEIHEIKPENYGKQKKSKKKGGSKAGVSKEKYVVSAYLGSTFGKSFRIDLRTIDPASAYFMKEVSL